MSSVADSSMVDEFAAMVAAAPLEQQAYMVADRADILHASEAQVCDLYEGVVAGRHTVGYTPRDGWLVDGQPVAAWVAQQQGSAGS